MKRLPEKTAMIVVDVQVGLFCSPTPPHQAAEVIERINGLARQARRRGMPVIFIQHEGAPHAGWLVPFTKDWELHPRLEREEGDLVIAKATGDAFFGTTLEAELRRRGVQAVLLTGYATDYCIDATLRNAVSKEFQVWLAADAHTTDDGPALQAEQIRGHFNWIWANSLSPKGVEVVPSLQLDFGSSQAAS